MEQIPYYSSSLKKIAKQLVEKKIFHYEELLSLLKIDLDE